MKIKVQVKKETSKTTRTKRPCPLPLCKSQVIHLPRHLQDVHGWLKEHSRTALTRFGMRKTYTFSDKGKVPKKKKKAMDEEKVETEATTRKDYHKYRYCPLHGCTSLVKRIPAHLKNVHHMDPASEEYRDALSRVRGAVEESYMKPYHERPRARLEKECSPVTGEDEEEDEGGDQEENASSIQSADSTTPEVICKFETWLKSADGGNLDESTSKQHRAQVSKLLKLIDSNQDLVSLFNEKVLNDKFLEGFAKKKYHPKTTKSYLMSLRHFYSFCLTGDFGINIPTERILSLKEKVGRWSSSLRKGCSKRHWEKMEEDLHSLISPEQIGEFERSKAARDAICLIGQLSGAHSVVLSQSQYTLIRDFLLVEISIDNANRAGALANMKVGEYKRATKHDEEYVVLVTDHKTLQTHGPARVVLSSRLHSWMDIFLAEVRSKVPGVTGSLDKSLFLTWNGESMESSQINKAIKSVWKKAGMKGSPSSTLLRKSAVSTVHTNSESNEARGNLADLMAHNVDTARKYYRLQEKSKSSVEASKHLRNVMRVQAQGALDQPKSVPADTPSLSVTSKSSRESWSLELASVVKDVFKNEIEKEEISIETVRSKISNHPQLKDQDPKKVLDKIRAQWRFQMLPSPDITSLPRLPTEEETFQERVQRGLEVENETPSEIVPPTLTSSVRGALSEFDLASLRTMFNDMVTKSFPIVKQRIKETLEKDPWGKDILKKVSLDTIVNRIKYERRVSRASK